jgi:hypothetical protein
MYIAQGIGQLNRQTGKRGQLAEHRVRVVSGEEVDLEGVPLPRSFLGPAQGWPHEKNRGDYKAF